MNRDLGTQPSWCRGRSATDHRWRSSRCRARATRRRGPANRPAPSERTPGANITLVWQTPCRAAEDAVTAAHTTRALAHWTAVAADRDRSCHRLHAVQSPDRAHAHAVPVEQLRCRGKRPLVASTTPVPGLRVRCGRAHPLLGSVAARHDGDGASPLAAGAAGTAPRRSHSSASGREAGDDSAEVVRDCRGRSRL